MRSIERKTWRSATSACAALVALAAAASAQSGHALPLSVVNNEDPAAPGSFTLDFGDPSLAARGSITTTNYELNVDAIQETASFVSYLQHVQPLTLPGGLSTGDITVQVVPGSSTGSFDPVTRTFSTNELYAVHFTGDLSAFGLTSPVLLPSSSSGELVFDMVEGGSVSMDWDGVGQLANPFDPTSPLTFTYRCAVNTLFPVTPANAVGLSLAPDVLSLDLPQGAENNLVAKLDQSLTLIESGNSLKASQTLRTFIRRVDRLSDRGVIDEVDAASIISNANETIELMSTGLNPVFPYRQVR